jgi:hypothetical protein
MRLFLRALAVSALVAASAQAGVFEGPCSPGADNGADWCDDFESYPTGNLHGVNNWQGWGAGAGDAAVAADVSTEQNHTPGGTKGLRIATNDDMVRIYSGYDDANADFYVLTTYTFVPNNATGEMFWLVLNGYDGGGAATNWSVQLNMDNANNVITNEGEVDASLPLIRGEWVEIRNEINMVANTSVITYGGQFLLAQSWTEGSSGGGTLNIAAIDLFSNGSSTFYYDDISLFSSEIPEVLPPTVDCELAGLTEEGCGDFLWSVRNENLSAPISTFYLDVEAGTGGQICTEDNITPPDGFTVDSCTGWVDGHALFRLTGPAFLPGDRVSGRLVVDANGADAAMSSGGSNIPPHSIVTHVAQDQGEAVCDPGDFSFGPSTDGDWSNFGATCTAFVPVPSMDASGKWALLLILVAGGTMLVLRSRRAVLA